MIPGADFRGLIQGALDRGPGLHDEEERRAAAAVMSRRARPIELRQGRAFFYQGDKAEAAWLLLDGRARAAQFCRGGRRVELPPRERGGWLGLPELVLGLPYLFDALCETDCLAAALQRRDFLLASSDAAFRAVLSRELAREVAALHEIVEDEGPEERILSFLLSRRRDLGGASAAAVSVTQEGIARAIGATRETVNKKLAALESMGLVRTRRGRVEVPDWNALAARRDESP